MIQPNIGHFPVSTDSQILGAISCADGKRNQTGGNEESAEVVDGTLLSLSGTFKCLTDTLCMDHRWRNAFNASFLRLKEIDEDSSSLNVKYDNKTRNGIITVAHCMVGQLRTWTLPTVHEHFRENVIRSPNTPFARHDLYFIIGTAQLPPSISFLQAAYSFSDMNIMAVVQSRAPGGSENQKERLLECLALIEATERDVGSQYDFIMKSRPDLLWDHPLPTAALADGTVISNNYDLVGICPRGTVSVTWPCDVPNGLIDDSIPGFKYIWDPALYPVSMKRLDDTVERVEMQLEWTYYYAQSLAQWVTTGEVTATRAFRCIMNFFAAGCNTYEKMQIETLSLTHLDDFVPSVLQQQPWSQEQTLQHSAFRVYSELRLALLADANSSVPQSVIDILVNLSGEYRHGTRGKFKHGGRDESSMMAADGSFTYLEGQCSGRHKYCRANSSYDNRKEAAVESVPDLIEAYFLELCVRAFETPISSRMYYYRKPAMHSQFDVTAAHSGTC